MQNSAMKPSPVQQSSTFLNGSKIAQKAFCSRQKYQNRDLTSVPKGLGVTLSYNQWRNKVYSFSPIAFVWVGTSKLFFFFFGSGWCC